MGADTGRRRRQRHPGGSVIHARAGPGRPPGKLGTLPAGTPPLNGSIGSGGAARSAQFDTAMNLLAKAQYDEAKAPFRAYADANPDDTDLAPQAIYWVGNIDYIQHRIIPRRRAPSPNRSRNIPSRFAAPTV